MLDRDENPAETRAEERANRDETQKGSAGRVESRAAAKTKRVSKETHSDRENTSNDSLKLELVRRTFLYRELSWCCSWSTPTGAVRGVHLAPLAPLTRAAHARYCIRRALVTTPPTSVHFYHLHL